MRLFVKQRPDKDTPKIEQIGRIVRMETPSLMSWMDTTIMNLGESYDKWRYHQFPAEEVTEHIRVLTAMWDEILSRKTD